MVKSIDRRGGTDRRLCRRQPIRRPRDRAGSARDRGQSADAVGNRQAIPAGVLVGGPPEKVAASREGLDERQTRRFVSVRCRDARGLLDRQTDPQATTYVIDPPMLRPSRPLGDARPETLRMGNVRVAAAFAGNALVYRMDDVQYMSDPYHAFIAEPGAMLGNRMAEWLDRAGPFKTRRPARQRGAGGVCARGDGHRALRRFPPGRRRRR